MELVIDIETTGLDPFTHRVIGIGVYNMNSNSIEIKFSKDEKELIEFFWDRFKRATTIVGYNIKGFDIHFMTIRSLKHDIEIPASPKRVIDLMEVLSNNDYKKRKRLSTVANFLGIEVKDRDASQIPALWEEGRIDELEEYLKKDLEITAEVFRKVKDVGLVEFREVGFV